MIWKHLHGVLRDEEDDGGGGGGGDDVTLGNFIKDDGTFRDGWTDKVIPDEYADARPTLQKYKSLNDLAYGVHSLNLLAGKKSGVHKVTEKSTPDEIKAFRQEMGVPEDIAGYGVQKPDDYPDGLRWDDDTVNKALEMFHEMNLPADAVKRLVEWDIERGKSALEQERTAIEKWEQDNRESLIKEWGANTDKNLALAERIARSVPGIDADQAKEMIKDANVAKICKWAADQVGEDRIVAGDTAAAGGRTNMQLAEDVMNNAANPLHAAYHDAMHPSHDHAVSQVSRYVEEAVKRGEIKHGSTGAIVTG